MNSAPTSAERLKALAACAGEHGLDTAVHDLCAEFGKVTRIHILTIAQADERKALCFLRLESEAQERQLMSSLDACRFGKDVLVVVDLAR